MRQDELKKLRKLEKKMAALKRRLENRERLSEVESADELEEEFHEVSTAFFDKYFLYSPCCMSCRKLLITDHGVLTLSNFAPNTSVNDGCQTLSSLYSRPLR